MLTNPDLVSKLLDWSNYLYVFAIVVTVLATFGVVFFGKVVTKLKDAQVQQYQKDADVRIAASNQHAADRIEAKTSKLTHYQDRGTLARFAYPSATA
jgi:hypothetical protein